MKSTDIPFQFFCQQPVCHIRSTSTAVPFNGASKNTQLTHFRHDLFVKHWSHTTVSFRHYIMLAPELRDDYETTYQLSTE